MAKRKVAKRTTRKIRATKRASSRKKVASKRLDGEELLTAVFSYLSVLVLIPFVGVRKRNRFVKFHLEQGINIFLLEVIIILATWILNILLAPAFFIGAITLFVAWILLLVLGIISIIALIQALKGKLWKIPLFGDVKIFSLK